MLKIHRTKEKWAEIFSEAKCGHILWDGCVLDPYNPMHAYTGSHHFVNQATNFGFFNEGNKILDLGCGNGRMGIALSERNIELVGIDPLLPSIEFCQKVFDPYKNITWIFADVWNEVFNPSGTVKAENYRIPYNDEYFDDIIVYSVFTHLQTLKAAENYMNEVRRVLKPKGKLFTSWYRAPPNPVTDDVGRTAYYEWDILSMLHGFTCNFSYGGHSDKFYDQWALFLTKK
jgi:ubiquinone/menaquinone biosynthesis C-methylase UbiE